MQEMPQFGLGLYQVPAASVEDLVNVALSTGYRLFDTASGYRNEAALGSALRKLLPLHGLTRDDIWITSKLAPADHGYEQAKAAVRRSVEMIGMGMIDLFLVHWPGKAGLPPGSAEHRRFRQETWRALEDSIMEAGLLHIGVSNYEPRHLEEMKEYARIMPFVNQVEVHPLFPNLNVIESCHRLGIKVQAYASLAQGKLTNEEFIRERPSVQAVMNRHEGSTAGQVFLAWALYKGYSVLPRSVRPERIRENAGSQCIRLDEEDMRLLDALADDKQAGKVCWNPSCVA